MVVSKTQNTPEQIESLHYWLSTYYNKPFTGLNSTWTDELQEMLLKFQGDNKLVQDGIAGPITLSALDSKRSDYSFVTCDADYFYKGASNNILRSDIAELYKMAYKEIKSLGGQVTSAGSLRALEASVTRGRSSTSLHYLAIAFDLHTTTAMMNPATDTYIVTKDTVKSSKGVTYWNVWFRSDKGTYQTLTPITYTNRTNGKPISGKFVNMTAILAKYGFENVPAHAAFFTKPDYITAEWWHFQNKLALMPKYSVLYNELNKFYDTTRLSPNFDYTKSKMWRVNWNG